MRSVLIAIAVLAVVYFAVLGFAGSTEEPPADPTKFRPGPVLAKVGAIAAALFPRATFILPGGPFEAQQGSGVRRVCLRASSEMRAVKLALTSGRLARITYECADRGCPKRFCLVAPGATPPSDCQQDPSNTGGFALEPAGGCVQVEALGPEPVRVESR